MKILIQGAFLEEINELLSFFNPKEHSIIASYEFWEINYKNHSIIISLTQKGIINASIATTIAIQKFNPDLIINQGCAGGHVSKLKLGDIVIGESSKYINDFKTPIKQIGEGSNSLTWMPHTSRSYVSHSTPKYVDIAKQVKTSQQIYLGALGSADTHSRECDRINYLHSLFDHLCEDMESAAAMKVCTEFNVDRIAFRIISNNDLTSIQFDKSPLKIMQQFVIDFIKLIN